MSSVILHTLLDPAGAVRRHLPSEPLGAAVLTMCLAALSGAVSQLLAGRTLSGYGADGAFMVWAFMVNLAVFAVVCVGGLLLIPVFVHLLGGRLRLGPLAWALPLSFAPFILATPLSLVAACLGGALGAVITVPGYGLLACWWLGVLSRMVAEIAGIDLLRGLLAVAMGFGAALVLMGVALPVGCVSGLNFLAAVGPPAP